MRPIDIIVDSGSDLSTELRKKYEIGLIRFSLYSNGKEELITPDSKSGQAKECYDMMRKQNWSYTLPATELEIKTQFSQCLRKEHDILYIALPQILSTSIVKARRIADELREKYPEAKIEIIDGCNASIGLGMLAMEAAEMAQKDEPMEKIVSYIAQRRHYVKQFVTVESLRYLSHANKLQSSSALLGDFLHMKPILVAGRRGEQVADGTVKGRENSIREVVKRLEEAISGAEKQTVYIMHGDAPDTAALLREWILEKNLPIENIEIGCFGAIIGSVIGPDAIGVFAFGKEPKKEKADAK